MCSAVSLRATAAVPRLCVRAATFPVRPLRQPVGPTPEDRPTLRFTRLQDASYVQLPE
jgi:hypothetical protein